MSPNTAVAMEDILQFEMFREQGAFEDAEAAVAAFLSSETQGQRHALKTLEVESFSGGEEGGRQQHYHHVPVVYTPDKGKRPYKDSPSVYINNPLYRRHVRSINCQFYTTQPSKAK